MCFRLYCCRPPSRCLTATESLTSALTTATPVAFTPSSHFGNQLGGRSRPKGGLPSASYIRGGVHLRLDARRRRHQRKNQPLQRTAQRQRAARSHALGPAPARLFNRSARERLLRRLEGRHPAYDSPRVRA